MSKIIRTKTRAEGGITPEELERMKEHNKFWIQNALRTDSVDVDEITRAIEKLYEVSGLEKPKVVVVPSPIAMAFTYGASAAIWYNAKNNNSYGGEKISNTMEAATSNATDIATWHATDIATWDATWDATRRATWDATWDATRRATDIAARDATRTVTSDATWYATYDVMYDEANYTTDALVFYATIPAASEMWNATRAATDNATRAAASRSINDRTSHPTRITTYNATDIATRASTWPATFDVTWNAIWDVTDNTMHTTTYTAAKTCYALAGELGIECAKNWHNNYQGGAYWSGALSHYSAMRDIIGLDLPEFKKYQAWENAGKAAPFRVMHEKFCVVSDFPEVLKIDNENRPHCENGPSHRWRDGLELYHWHGVRIPDEWIKDKSSLTAETAITWENIEQRRAACEIIGWDAILKQLNAIVIDKDEDPMIGTLVEVDLPNSGRERFLRVLCGTSRQFALPVPPDMRTALQANAWTYGYDDVTKFIKPEVRT